MKTEQHVKSIIGDLVIQIAQLRAENDELREQVQASKADPEPGKASAIARSPNLAEGQ